MITATTTTDLNYEILSSNIYLLDQRLNDTEKNYQTLYDGSANLNNQLSTQISAASYTIDALAIFFVIVGIFITWYIHKSLDKIIHIKKEIAEMKDFISEHNDALYKRLENSETTAVIHRLNEEPQDIGNRASLLLSRKLAVTHFEGLKSAYLKLKEIAADDINCKIQYQLVFSQHFPYESIRDPLLQEDFIEIVFDQYSNMYKNDMKNLFSGVLKFIEEIGVSSELSKLVLKKILNNLYTSKHRGLINDFRTEANAQNMSPAEILKLVSATPEDIDFTMWFNS